jgi:hypothetical protein
MELEKQFIIELGRELYPLSVSQEVKTMLLYGDANRGHVGSSLNIG